MSLNAFFRRFLFHTALASVVLFVILLIGEIFVPGSVLPFIDVVDFGIVVLALVVAAGVFSSES